MNKKTITVTVAAAITAAAITAGSAMAYRNNSDMSFTERHNAMEQAFENKDFEAWKELHEGRGRISEVIDSQEKFEQMAKAHEFMEEGDMDKAHEIMEDLGMMGQGGMMGRGRMMDGDSEGMMGR